MPSPTQAEVESDIRHTIQDASDIRDSRLHEKVNVMEYELKTMVHDLQQIKSSLTSFLEKQDSREQLGRNKWETDLAKSNLEHEKVQLRIETDLKGLRKDAATNWPLLGTIGSITVAIIGFIVASMIQPLNGRIEVLTSGVTHNATEIQSLRDSTTKGAAADSASTIDRVNLNLKTVENTRLINDVANKLSTIESNFQSRTTEVETQIDSTAQASAIQVANLIRKNNELQAAIAQLGGKLPPPNNDPYIFPNMSNREHKSQSSQ